MENKDFFLSEFGNRFRKFKKRKMVFYLNDFNPTLFFQKYHDFNIVGVMDKYTVGGMAYGKEILSYERVLELQTDIIVIASESIYYEIIRSRICEFCRINNIQLYTIDGIRLSVERDYTITKYAYYNFGMPLMKKMIDKYQVISFNIFDTLIMYRVLEEVDVYQLIANKLRETTFNELDFVRWRKQVERELKLINRYTLDESYKLLQKKLQLTDWDTNFLLETEKEVRRNILVPRQDMVDVLNYAKENGKKVLLIENSFLPKEYIKELLKLCGVERYDEILISSSNNYSRNYERILSYLNDGMRSLHIGQDDTSKVQVILNGKVSMCRILRARDMLNISAYNDYFNEEFSYYERLKWGYFISNLFNSPFALYHTEGRGKINKTYDIGQLYIAPIVMDFMVWLIKNIKQNDVEKILFASRDGYIVQKLYELMVQNLKLKGMPVGQYFLTSRLLSIIAQINSVEDIKDALKQVKTENAEDILLHWFMLKKVDIKNFDRNRYSDSEEYILDHSSIILEKAREISRLYKEYGDEFGIRDSNKIGIFDFVASGTCQVNINKIFGKNFEGYYFYRLSSKDLGKQKLNIKSFAAENKMIEENSLFMECIFSSPDATILGFDKKGRPIYDVESRTSEEIDYCMELQRGIFDYVEKMIYMLGDINALIIKEESFYFLDFLHSGYTIIENEMFKNYVVKDEFIRCESHVGNMYQY